MRKKEDKNESLKGYKVSEKLRHISRKRFVGFPVPSESDGILRWIVVEKKKRATKNAHKLCSHSLTVGSKHLCLCIWFSPLLL